MTKLMAVLLALVAAPAFASDNSLALKVFGVQTQTQIQAQGTDYDGALGPGFGLEYLHRVNTHISVGGEIDQLTRGTNESALFLNGVNTAVSGSVLAILAIARLDLMPENTSIHPYIMGGLGLAEASLHAEGTPQTGFAWKNGGSDTRTLIDESHEAMGLTIRAGADFPVNESLSLGAEVGLVRTSDVTYGLTSQGQALLGNTFIKGPQSSIIFGGSASYHF